jgi:hypothetical protein
MRRKLIASIQVEFVASEGQPDNVLTIALNRGLSKLREAIERGDTGMTGIKSGSVQTSETHEIVDDADVD